MSRLSINLEDALLICRHHYGLAPDSMTYGELPEEFRRDVLPGLLATAVYHTRIAAGKRDDWGLRNNLPSLHDPHVGLFKEATRMLVPTLIVIPPRCNYDEPYNFMALFTFDKAVDIWRRFGTCETVHLFKDHLEGTQYRWHLDWGGVDNPKPYVWKYTKKSVAALRA